MVVSMVSYIYLHAIAARQDCSHALAWRTAVRARVYGDDKSHVAGPTGVGINYFLDMRVARAAWIWPSLMCFSLAALLGALTHVRRFKALKARR